ncbi:hypothetical protein SLEP1_g20599 [Rubroshorea leprosula]|uniref:Protein kinase domain-containing protein n=1 Tax=Rubroshorea leprosula TaxID=152421 RepID=A0AAV5J9C1_9ROSI|nr:hypothetical protein SLEP1_g20599 [Rubroshorea leprosula]
MSLFWFLPFFFLLHPLVFSELAENQRSVMKNLYQLLNDTGTSSSWNVNQDPCLWQGVSCSSPNNNSIISLSLSGFGFSSSDLLIEVCKIDSLQSLDLSNNFLRLIPVGFFSGCGGIGGLKLLDISKNRLVGSLPAFQNFVRLEFLDLSHNILSGKIDSQLSQLVSLIALNLSFNSFSGSIPEAIGNLSKLQLLVLSSNNLSGEIPKSVSSISTLQRFAANQNNFSGAVPDGITRYLKILDLGYNKLTGLIPSDLLSQSSLQHVDLSYNLLSGLIPEKMSSSLVRLRLGSNSLSGSISTTFAALKNLAYLELDNNSFTGFIPQEVGSCQNLMLLNLAQNNLTGTLPVQLGSLTKLRVMKLQLNNLWGQIPTEITQLQNLEILNISWNSLTGPIPSSISELTNLMNMNLRSNNLNGSIPITLGDMKSLLELQLGGNKLSGRIPKLPPNLQIALNLSSNLFVGPIPGSLSQLQRLEVLDLSNNGFSDKIPDSLTKMSSLTQLILFNNQLSGVVPQFSKHVSVNTSGNPNLINATTPSTSSIKGKSFAVAFVVALVVAAFVVGVVMLIVQSVSRRFSWIADEQLQSPEDLPLHQVIQGNLLTTNGIHRSNIDFNKAMEAVASPENVVQKTRFSTYYKAIMPSGTSYVIKKLCWSDKIFQLGNHDIFEQELQVLGKLNNSNVMIPLAYVLTVDSAYLFYEFSPKGTLFEILHGTTEDILDWASRYSIAVGVAQGLAFLHGCNSSPILLLDLSSRNIMLRSLKEPQVADIELCKVINPSKSIGSLSTVCGSVGYIPPEYAYTMRVTMAGNVYSFGVILLELLTGKPAVSEGTELAKWVLRNSVQQNNLYHILDFNTSGTSLVVRNQMLSVLKVAVACVSASPEARPKMKSVLRMLLNAR